MTIKSVKDEDFADWQVRDLDTGKILENVEYADDETGLCIIRTRSNRGTILRTLKSGRIKLEDKRLEVEPEEDPLLDAYRKAIELVAFLAAQLENRRQLGEMINEAMMTGVRKKL